MDVKTLLKRLNGAIETVDSAIETLQELYSSLIDLQLVIKRELRKKDEKKKEGEDESEY